MQMKIEILLMSVMRRSPPYIRRRRRRRQIPFRRLDHVGVLETN